MQIIVIYPVHLFQNNDLLENQDKSIKRYIIEDPVYFTKYMTHKLKLILHRASMKKYADKYKLTYIEYHEADKFYKNNKSKIICYDPVDRDVFAKIQKFSEIEMYETPEFITSYEDLEIFHNQNKTKRFIHDTQFYKWQRSRLDILNNTKLSYDQENRKPFIKNQKDVFNPDNKKNKNVF